MTLDRAKLTAIGHADHVICNPVGAEKVDGVLDLLDLPPGGCVLDAGCGKAEILMRLIERRGRGGGAARGSRHRASGQGGTGQGAGRGRGAGRGECRGESEEIGGKGGREGIRCVGVDLNPRFLDEARRAAATRVPEGSLELIEGDVAAYLKTSSGPFDIALCTGSTHAFGGYRQTLHALARVVRPGGQLLVGEGYWRKDPEPGYLTALGTTRAEFHDHAGNVAVGVEEGLVPLYSTVSSGDEWDRYEGLYLRAVERYTAEHPEDPDTPALRDHIRRWRDAYLRWGRDTLGFGLYLFRVEPGRFD
jgi:ubiquinone/menaquinone biosynthesis C-methylase UbiE